MMLMVVIGYTLAWLPLNLFQLYMVRSSEESPLPHIEYIFFSVHWLAMAHTAYNPLIYAWINTRFRSAFLQVNPVSSLIANRLSPGRVVWIILFVCRYYVIVFPGERTSTGSIIKDASTVLLASEGR
jgi:hypothetical protein